MCTLWIRAINSVRFSIVRKLQTAVKAKIQVSSLNDIFLYSYILNNDMFEKIVSNIFYRLLWFQNSFNIVSKPQRDGGQFNFHLAERLFLGYVSLI